MADIASSDVTYTITTKDIVGGNKRRFCGSIVFGNASLTYPTGGVPLVKGKMGLPNNIESFNFVDPMSSDGFVYKYDLANNKIRIYQGDNNNASDAALIELIGGSAAPAATTLKFEAIGF